ncbi:MAG TPA: thiamine-phosphate kinase [Abditibacteriaceae bacterium]
MNLRELGEFGLIGRLSTQLARRGGVKLAIGDDAALLDALQAPLVTCDCLVEEIHFRRDWTSARDLGFKAVSVNVSDIAAMGGRPVAAFVSLALSTRDELAWVEELYTGLEEAAALYGLTICGGDTARSPLATVLSITLVGEAPLAFSEPRPITRSDAQVGNIVLVTGTLGDSAAGLALLQNPDCTVPEATRAYLLARHHKPVARLREVEAVQALALQASTVSSPAVSAPAVFADASRVLTAGMDLSDGLAGDAAHIARASQISIEIETAKLPISPPCRAAATALGVDVLDWALAGGEDYELLWCAPAAKVDSVIAAVQAATATPVTAIGRCVAAEEQPVKTLHPDGTVAIAVQGFQHF